MVTRWVGTRPAVKLHAGVDSSPRQKRPEGRWAEPLNTEPLQRYKRSLEKARMLKVTFESVNSDRTSTRISSLERLEGHLHSNIFSSRKNLSWRHIATNQLPANWKETGTWACSGFSRCTSCIDRLNFFAADGPTPTVLEQMATTSYDKTNRRKLTDRLQWCHNTGERELRRWTAFAF